MQSTHPTTAHHHHQGAHQPQPIMFQTPYGPMICYPSHPNPAVDPKQQQHPMMMPFPMPFYQPNLADPKQHHQHPMMMMPMPMPMPFYYSDHSDPFQQQHAEDECVHDVYEEYEEHVEHNDDGEDGQEVENPQFNEHPFGIAEKHGAEERSEERVPPPTGSQQAQQTKSDVAATSSCAALAMRPVLIIDDDKSGVPAAADKLVTNIVARMAAESSKHEPRDSSAGQSKPATLAPTTPAALVLTAPVSAPPAPSSKPGQESKFGGSKPGPARHGRHGRHRSSKPIQVSAANKSSSASTAPFEPVKNVVAIHPVETYSKAAKAPSSIKAQKVAEPQARSMSERISASDGNDLSDALTDPDSVCMKCQKHTLPRVGLRYCSDCFKTLPFCLNYEECGYRTDNKDHGYCSFCYYEYREACVECRSNYYFDGSGLCPPCAKNAPPVKKGTCRQWWVAEDEDGVARRVVCGEACRGRRFCHDCWQDMKQGDDK